MAEKQKHHGKSKNGNKTHGRNKEFCEGYKRRGQREKNKIFKIQKHLDTHPKDAVAFAALQRIPGGKKASLSI